MQFATKHLFSFCPQEISNYFFYRCHRLHIHTRGGDCKLSTGDWVLEYVKYTVKRCYGKHMSRESLAECGFQKGIFVGAWVK